jgi:phosphoadenosine phosphosulfate reductase
VRDVTTTTPVDITPAPPAPRAIEIPDLDELAEISRRFEHRPASATVAWAYDRFGDDLVLAASFQDCVLIDIVYKTVPDVEVAFLDTQYHFAETLWYVEQVKARYGLNLNVIRPERDPDDLWHNDPDACCRVRKVEPMRRALAGKAAWMSGLRRTESAARAKTPLVSYDVSRGLVKLNPIAGWSDADVAGYVKDHDLPMHPLAERGYDSIGCWPCTRPVDVGEDSRAGRWAGLDKTECGLHL